MTDSPTITHGRTTHVTTWHVAAPAGGWPVATRPDPTSRKPPRTGRAVEAFVKITDTVAIEDQPADLWPDVHVDITCLADRKDGSPGAASLPTYQVLGFDPPVLGRWLVDRLREHPATADTVLAIDRKSVV